MADGSNTPENVVDGLGSLVTSMTEQANKGQNVRFTRQDRTLQEYCTAYETDFLAQQTVDVPANDATRAWRIWNGDPEQIKALRETEARVLVRDRVCQALKISRAIGGSGIIIHDGSGEENLTQPLDVKRVKRDGLRSLVVATRLELIPSDGVLLVTDPEDVNYGLPEMWLYSPENTSTGKQVQIHHSRIAFFRGRKRLINQHVNEWWWGDSVLKSTLEAIRNAKGVRDGSAHLAQEAAVDVIKQNGLTNHLATQGGEDTVLKYALLMKQLKGNYGMLLLDAEDTYERNAYTFAGLNDLLTTTHALVASSADIPQTRLLGQSPGGMNATGEHDALNYNHTLEAVQDSEIQPAICTIDDVIMMSALGTIPDGMDYDWQLPDMLTQKEKAEIAKSRAETAAAYVATGTVPTQVLEATSEAAIGEGGDLPGGRAAYEDYHENPEPDDPRLLDPDSIDPAEVTPAKPSEPEG